ncbi:inositol monophosphatase family protein [Synechococcus sp. PCC 6312]|uniref:inositol monophosphatase family protein n=1 Tax=Synechococcus sp. (strain ATCC 27167 / PCC 6312) TaxID=195253 RepID=UPI00029ED613|nr:inositol monophosphatase family protein [Synechococcus sp. PCC 6312]AFY61033.1 inositol monophosphatase/fructose-1,6-bisphosphatase family protein [Synechococcus sp. PCC 6312]
MSDQFLADCLAVATEAALAGGKILQAHWGQLEMVEEKGRSGDLVTIADKESEAAVLGILQKNFPSHQILAEESGRIGTNTSPYLWAIDPLDGTTNYAHQYPFSAVSIGLLVEGEPQVGVIFDPFHQELFAAAKGLGATVSTPPLTAAATKHLHVSHTSQLRDSLLVTGFAYDRRETSDNNYAEFCYLTHLTQGVRRAGAAAIDLAYVACGRLDGYWERGLSPWDLAAGVVIVREAGGVVTAYDQSALVLETGRILATNGRIHSQLSQALTAVAPIKAQFPDFSTFPFLT